MYKKRLIFVFQWRVSVIKIYTTVVQLVIKTKSHILKKIVPNTHVTLKSFYKCLLFGVIYINYSLIKKLTVEAKSEYFFSLFLFTTEKLKERGGITVYLE